MNNQSKYVKLHVGSMITLRALQSYLDDEHIPCLIKNYTESQRLSGFGGNENGNELFVYEEDFNKAKEVLKTFLKN